MPKETTVDDVMQGFDYDPYTAGLPTSKMKLIFNAYEECTDEYAAKRADGRKVPQWVLVFEDGLRSDYNDRTQPRIVEQRINLAYWRKKKGSAEGEMELVKHGPRSIPTEFATMSKAKSDINLNPNIDGNKYVGQWFTVIQHTFGKEPPYQKKLWVPIELLGPETPPDVEEVRATWGQPSKNGKDWS